jgi:predicted NBD/HSP70 family sugar kinase
VLEAANLEGWVDVPARDILRETLDVPVLLGNDINLAASGEQWRGGGVGVGTFVFISLGTGVGAGIVIDGKIHRGHKWHAGEISHLNLDFREWDTDFGAAGYLESYLGGTPRAGASRARRVHAEEFDGDTITRLGVAVANISTILDPDLIIFGGRRARAQSNLLDSVYRVAAAVAPNCPEIRATELGDDAALHGCVRTALGVANESLLELLPSATTAAEQHDAAPGVHQV